MIYTSKKAEKVEKSAFLCQNHTFIIAAVFPLPVQGASGTHAGHAVVIPYPTHTYNILLVYYSVNFREALFYVQYCLFTIP